mmetsp:Transcript_107541/g.213584  ORF Transcript_107541/g.213584 Transcript_107541/m.213584 type:complete len:271 (+) Transcript_107541:118-930(+)
MVVLAARLSCQGALFRGGTNVNHISAVQRRFSWTDADKVMGFKVKAEGVDIQKLAGGILLRAEQRMYTHLECMGSKSVYNGVKALVLANYFANKARQERDCAIMRIGFVPSLGRSGKDQWVRLTVLAMGKGTASLQQQTPNGSAGLGESSQTAKDVATLKVSSNTEIAKLANSVLTNWMQRCAGSLGSDPRLGAMGSVSVSTAVKATAFALRELNRRRGGARPFMCIPSMEREPRREEEQTVTYLRLEQRPRPGDSHSPLLTPAHASVAK